MIENQIGFEYETDSYLCFFGKADTTTDDLISYYKDIDFRNIKQTHSNILINSDRQSVPPIEADAHWTSQRKVGLLIRTADCLPIMVYDQKQKRALAIHAGWKGVASKIAAHAMSQLKIDNCDVIVGPHIRQKSFEVDEIVMNQLLDGINTNNLCTQKEDKYFIDLEKIIQNQINSLAYVNQYISLEIDTKTDQRFNSYRRNKNCGRNLSFIFIK